MNKKTRENIINGLISLLVFIIILISIVVVLNKLGETLKNHSEEECNSMGGELIFYECFNSPISNCAKIKTGNYCRLSNGTEIDVTIRNAIS